MTNNVIGIDHLKPRQAEVKALARQWLDTEHLAELLLYRAYDEIKRAMFALMHAAHERRLQRLIAEELSAEEHEADIEADAFDALGVLIEAFGTERIIRLAKQFDYQTALESDNE